MKKMFLIVLVLCNLNAENTEFIKEYRYNASDDDSKNSSRKKAITQIKSLVSEEVGSMIKSSLIIKAKQKNEKFEKLVDSKIQSMSQSFIQLSIIEEKWDGSQYYIKAKVKVDKAEAESIVEEFRRNETTFNTSVKTFVEMQREQPMFVAGKLSYYAESGDIYEVLAEIDCLNGDGKCWAMKNIKTDEKGVAKVVVLKSFHKVYEK